MVPKRSTAAGGRRLQTRCQRTRDGGLTTPHHNDKGIPMMTADIHRRAALTAITALLAGCGGGGGNDDGGGKIIITTIKVVASGEKISIPKQKSC